MKRQWSLLVLGVLLLAEKGVCHCPALLSATQDPTASCSFNNCSSLTCSFPAASQLVGNVTFHVENCSGPVVTHVGVALVGAPLAYKGFTETGFLHLALGRSVRVELSRNASYLSLEVEYKPVTANATFSHPVVPPVQIYLNPTECMCQSVEDTARSVQSNSLIHSCDVNPDCTGVRCLISAVGQTGYVETIILPCEGALDVVVEDQNFVPVSRQVFDRTESRNVNVQGYSVRADVTLEKNEYSMVVALSLYQLFIGTVKILPRHTIILDKTNCSTPDLSTLAPPPAPTPAPPVPADSSILCHSLYDNIVSQNYTEPLICTFLGGACNMGVSCTLLLFGSSYSVDLRATPGSTGANYFSYNVVSRDGGTSSLRSQDDLTTIANLPSPQGAELLFIQASFGEYLKRIQIDLHLVFEQEEFLDVVIPRRVIRLRQEMCGSILAAAQEDAAATNCYALGDCSGLSCTLTLPESGAVALRDVSVSLDKCKDPVVSMVTVLGNGSSFQKNVSGSGRVFFGGGESLMVDVTRNATYANLTVSFQGLNSTAPVVPPVLIPLNASTCMCQSLTGLAQASGHAFIETNCAPNQACDGVKCTLTILGSTYYLETVILPCVDAIEWLVEDSASNILAAYRFNETERRDIVILNLPLTVDVTLVKKTYSMDIMATLTEELFGEIEIIPRHTIILDRTHCSHRDFTPLLPPPPATPPASYQTEPCAGFYRAITNAAVQEPFTCQYYNSCDVGIQCTLNILSSAYTVIISLNESGRSLDMMVRDGGGKFLDVKEFQGGANVGLPFPNRSSLNFTTQQLNDREFIGMKLDLYVYSLSGELRRDVLIPYTEVGMKLKAEPSPASKGVSKGVVIGAVIVVLLLVVTATAVVVVIVAVVFIKKRRSKQFTFQRMGAANDSPSLKFSGMEDKKPDRNVLETADDGDSEDEDGFKKVDLSENSGLGVLFKR